MLSPDICFGDVKPISKKGHQSQPLIIGWEIPQSDRKDGTKWLIFQQAMFSYLSVALVGHPPICHMCFPR